MRIISKDPKLGVSKVIWKFSSEPEAEVKEPPVQDIEVEEPILSCPFESAEEEPEVHIPVQSQQEIRNDHAVDLRQQIRFLQQVIESQNQQLKTKDELLRNFQVLLKTEQEQVLMLEARVTHKTNSAGMETMKLSWFQSLKRKLRKHDR